jgi:hypothetical protein
MRMRLKSRRILLLTALLLLQPCCSTALASAPKPLSPSQSVRDFCRLDFQGVRLSSKHPSAQKFAHLLAGDGEFPEEPVKIVAAYHVLAVSENDGTATVHVTYELLGQLTGALESDGITLQRASEEVEFSLLRANGLWKVKPFDFPPHVSARALRDHIRDVLLDDQHHGDSHRQDLLRRMMAKLETAGP